MEDEFLSLLACPQCYGPLDPQTVDEGRGADSSLVCQSEGLRFPIRDGIPYLIRPDREAELEIFALTYGQVWQKEGWGSSDPAYLLGLPWRDTTGRHSRKWRVKGRSLEALLRFLHGIEPEVIADLGAGTGWLSHHLARQGYRTYALDILIDQAVGLGAAATYLRHGTFFQRVRGEIQRPPLRTGSLDVAICNASLHYVSDLRTALRDIRRILAPGGSFVVMNSPVHSEGKSARRAQEDFRDHLRGLGASEGVASRYQHFVRGKLEKILKDLVGPVREIPFDPGRTFRLIRRLKGLVLQMELASFPILVSTKPARG